MKHTSFIPMDSCSREGRNPNVLKSPPDEGNTILRIFPKILGLILMVCLFTNVSLGQTVLTGTGSGAGVGLGSGVGGFTFSSGIFKFPGAGLPDDTPGDGKLVVKVCPDDMTTQLVKIAFDDFDIAPGDTIAIHQGCGTDGAFAQPPYYGGGSSAANSLNSSWFVANCESDGCLTVVYSPNGDNNKGTGFSFTTSNETRMADISCPSDAIVAATCNLNGGSNIAGLHTVQGLNGTCNVAPAIVQVDIYNGTTGALMTPIATALQMNQAEFIDLDGSGTLSVGESIYLRPNTYNIDVIYAALDGTNDTCSYGVIVDSGITPVCNLSLIHI